MVQTILGAGGAIGVEVAKVLTAYTLNIRLVARNPKKVNDSDELFVADLTDRQQIFKAVEGSSIVYLTVGFNYNIKVWQKLWPPLARNVVDACIAHGAKLVFFDNIYAIGDDHVKHITESSPINPSSQKGQVRAEVDRIILEASEKNGLKAIIARSPDFFGVIKDKSVLMNLIYDNLAKDKKAQWFCNAKVVHSCGYAPDLGKGTAMLGNTDDAFQQIWNLPTDSERITGEGWVQLFADVMKTGNKVQVLPAWGVKALGLFVPILREMHEMLYQYDRDYFFDSSKFNKRFNYTPIPNAEAVRQVVEALKGK
jgi:nucleoside-diphosphate-sugar epimerase